MDKGKDPDASTLGQYHYELPGELIAQKPLPLREASRLLTVYRQEGSLSHHKFSDLPELLRPGDLLVANNTRVLPARLEARRSSGGRVSLLLLFPDGKNTGIWQALAKPLRKLFAGERLTLVYPDQPASSENGQAQQIEVLDVISGNDGQKRVLIDLGPSQLTEEIIRQAGQAPLPPYIKRKNSRGREADIRQLDLDRYQTIFATAPGAVAAPTAGLHFSEAIIKQLQKASIELTYVTLRVGPGTFKPITTSLDEHIVESERYSITPDSASRINQALETGRRIIAVGTTTCRALESAWSHGQIEAISNGSTSLYIRPGYHFQVIKGLITNFHVSRSSLLLLVCAFVGRELTLRAYQEAVKSRYRFFSYGDAMLIL